MSKTTWRYLPAVEASSDGEKYWTIREVYESTPAGEVSWTSTPVEPFGDSRADLRVCLQRMLEAFLPNGQVLDLTVDPPRVRRASEAGE